MPFAISISVVSLSTCSGTLYSPTLYGGIVTVPLNLLMNPILSGSCAGSMNCSCACVPAGSTVVILYRPSGPVTAEYLFPPIVALTANPGSTGSITVTNCPPLPSHAPGKKAPSDSGTYLGEPGQRNIVLSLRPDPFASRNSIPDRLPGVGVLVGASVGCAVWVYPAVGCCVGCSVGCAVGSP